MPESRDRLQRPQEDLLDIYARRMRSIGRGGFRIFQDEPDHSSFRLPVTTPATIWTPESRTPTRRGRGYGQMSRRTPARVIGQQNISPAGQGRRQGRTEGSRSVLPSWYPRRPLQDITYIVRAIERRAAREREREAEQLGSVVPQDRAAVDPPSVSTSDVQHASESTSGAQLEHEKSMITPHPTIRSSMYYPKSVGKVPKILLDITQQNNSGDSEFLTPQRRLLNSIDTVEKAVMEELDKLRRTPSARRAERQKKVQILMSMR